MKKFNKVLRYKVWDVVPHLYKDSLGMNALLLIDPNAEDGEQFIANCTAYVQCDLKENEILVKNYSENTDILKWLIENDVAHPTMEFIDNGYVTFPICTVNLDNFIDII